MLIEMPGVLMADEPGQNCSDQATGAAGDGRRRESAEDRAARGGDSEASGCSPTPAWQPPNQAIADDKLAVAQSPLIVPADFDAAPIKQLAATNATDEQQGDFTGPRDGMVWVSSSRGCAQASERRTHHAKLTMG
jgi:hypothetical protein